jgi:hypothetical protein
MPVTYIPVQVISPADIASQKQTGITLLGETKQGVVEQIGTRPGGFALQFFSRTGVSLRWQWVAGLSIGPYGCPPRMRFGSSPLRPQFE